MVGLLASIFLDREPGSAIVHDPRVIWNTQSIVKDKGGIAIQSKTGHAFIKQKCVNIMPYMVARCRHITISVILPSAIVV